METEGVYVRCADVAMFQFIKKVDDDVKALSKGKDYVVVQELSDTEMFVKGDKAKVLEDRIEAFLRNDPAGNSCEGEGKKSCVKG